MRHTLLAIVLTTTLSGCIGLKKHRLLESDLSATETDLAATKAALAERISALEAEEARTASLESELADATARIASLEADLEALRTDHAAALKDRSRLSASVAEMESALEELAARKAATEARLTEYKDLVRRFQRLIDAGRLRVKIVDGRMVVEMATDILFGSGRADVSKDGKAALEEVAAVLADIPERRYLVEGHTDDVPIATERFPSNWELASARATAVVRTLIDAGLAPERVGAASMSEYHPVGDNDAEDGRAQNRRIEIVVVPDLATLPGFEELIALEEAG